MTATLSSPRVAERTGRTTRTGRPGGMGAGAAGRAAYLRFLGLDKKAEPDAIEWRCESLLDWLESDDVPDELRPWAAHQIQLVEDSYRVLTGTGGPRPGTVTALGLAAGDSRSGGWRSRLPRAAAPLGLGILAGLLVAVAALLSTGGLAGLSLAPAAGGTGPQAAPQSTGAGVDPLAAQQGRIAQLEATVAGNPTPLAASAALFELGETYMHADQWPKAIEWFNRLLQIDPASVAPQVDLFHAQTDIAIAYLNLGQRDRAESALLDLVSRQPLNPQLHYTLGFLYASGPTANPAEAARHWQETVRLAPDSQWGKAAKSHLESLGSR